MFDLRKAPVARILIPFATGSLVGYHSLFSVQLVQVIILSLFLWLLMILAYIRQANKQGSGPWIFCVPVFLTFTATGMGTGMMTRPENPGLPSGMDIIITGEVAEEPKIRKQNWMFEMNLDLVVSDDAIYPVSTRVMVYMRMPEDSVIPAAGQSWQIYGQLAPIRNSGNPGSPDYESIMQRKNCWYRFYAKNHKQATRRRDNQDNRKIRASRIRRVIWDHWSGDPSEISLLRAVCLGDRSGLTDDMRQSYSHAGGMHLLAVSGLHVGLIWWVLHHSLAWTVRLFRREVGRALIVVSLLWSYAFLTGFSSSVCRSVTMFTFFTLSRLMDQRTHSVNGILLSAFILIAINPGRIMDVGFQLSYVAILGIVTLNPVFKRSVRIKNRVLKWAWEVTGVSLSAQVATAPLVVFYFHQLPTYSILTNLVAIPLLSILITVFVISIPSMALGILTVPFNWLLLKISYLLNLTMEVVSSIPGSVITNLTLSSLSLGFLIVIVLLLMMVPGDRTLLSKYLLVIVLSAILLSTSLSRFNALRSSELVIAHFSGGSLVTFKEGINVDHYLMADNPETRRLIDRYVDLVWNKNRYRCRKLQPDYSSVEAGSVSMCYPVGPGVWMLGNNSFSGGIVSGPSFRGELEFPEHAPINFILLAEEPDIVKMPPFLSRDIIIDGSNRGWYSGQPDMLQEWIHHTAKKGAYLKRW